MGFVGFLWGNNGKGFCIEPLKVIKIIVILFCRVLLGSQRNAAIDFWMVHLRVLQSSYWGILVNVKWFFKGSSETYYKKYNPSHLRGLVLKEGLSSVYKPSQNFLKFLKFPIGKLNPTDADFYIQLLIVLQGFLLVQATTWSPQGFFNGFYRVLLGKCYSNRVLYTACFFFYCSDCLKSFA